MSFSKLLAITLALCVVAPTVWAEPVTLKSTSSTVELVGELISFNNEVYVIESDLGVLEVDARTVTCTGASCPKIKSASTQISVFGNQVLMQQLLVPLLETYSFSLGATIDTSVQNDQKSIIQIASKKSMMQNSMMNGAEKDGREFATVSIQSGSLAELDDDILAAPTALVIKSTSADMLVAAKKDTKIVLLATDALVAITSDTNAVKSISFKTLRNVLTGEVTNWKGLGGPDAPINLYLPAQNSNLLEIAKGMGFDLANSATAVRFDDIIELSNAAANDPYGLGFTNFANLRTANALSIIGACGAYIRPDAFNIASGNYPATYYHYLQSTSDTPPVFAREFFTFLGDAQAREMIDRQGYPSLSVFENGLENQGNRIVHGLLATEKSIPIEDYRMMMRAFNGARQLSTVLRFAADSMDLSPQSSAALDVLVSELFLGDFADQTLMIAGFTGSKGSNGANKTKSMKAAQVIADTIKEADNSGLFADLQIEVLGFGEASPLSCEDTSKGTAINNRVEIWVKDAL